MEESLKNELIEAGVDYAGALHRFLDMEDMYINFLHRYEQDDAIDKMSEGHSKNDVQEIFNAAHSMKGLAGNLGIKPVEDLAKSLTEMVRNKDLSEVDMDSVGMLIEDIKNEDKMIRAIIARL